MHQPTVLRMEVFLCVNMNINFPSDPSEKSQRLLRFSLVSLEIKLEKSRWSGRAEERERERVCLTKDVRDTELPGKGRRGRPRRRFADGEDVEVVGAKAGDTDGDEDESKADDPMWQNRRWEQCLK